MIENKQWKIIDKHFISLYNGDGYRISNGEFDFWLWHDKEDSRKVCNKLNKLNNNYEEKIEQLKKENKQLKRENELMRSFIRRNHDVTMFNRILNE